MAPHAAVATTEFAERGLSESGAKRRRQHRASDHRNTKRPDGPRTASASQPHWPATRVPIPSRNLAARCNLGPRADLSRRTRELTDLSNIDELTRRLDVLPRQSENHNRCIDRAAGVANDWCRAPRLGQTQR